MTELLRVKARWSGFSGAPGYTVLHFRDFGTGDGGAGAVDSATALAAVTRVHTFFTAMKSILPSPVRIDVEGDVDVIEDTNGELVDSLSVTAPAQIAGSATGTFASASGGVIGWKTAGVRNGRRIRGRTFIIPLGAISLGTDGSLASGTRIILSQAAAGLADSSSTPDLGVYARPSSAGATDGRWSVVTGTSVPNKLAVLRSRRD